MKKTLSFFSFFCLITSCLLLSSSFAFMKGLSTEDLTTGSDLVIEGDV